MQYTRSQRPSAAARSLVALLSVSCRADASRTQLRGACSEANFDRNERIVLTDLDLVVIPSGRQHGWHSNRTYTAFCGVAGSPDCLLIVLIVYACAQRACASPSQYSFPVAPGLYWIQLTFPSASTLNQRGITVLPFSVRVNNRLLINRTLSLTPVTFVVDVVGRTSAEPRLTQPAAVLALD